MAKTAQAYADNRGSLHPTAEAAVLADLSAIIGRIGSESGLTSGLAKCILEKRGEIEQAFADLDAMTAFAGRPGK